MTAMGGGIRAAAIGGATGTAVAVTGGGMIGSDMGGTTGEAMGE